MAVLLLFSFVSGLATILAPCIWPLLPIILSSSTSGGHRKPLGITLGIIVSFSIFTLSISYLVMLFHFDPNILRIIAAITIAFLGLTMIIPSLLLRYELLITRLSSFIGRRPIATHHGFFGGFITGLSLGIVWSPCAGPILATIATLAATQTVSLEVVFITLAFAIGVGVPLFLFSLLGTFVFQKSRFISKYTGPVQRFFGVVMILTAFAIYTNYDVVIQARLLNAFPSFSLLQDQLENNKAVQEQLAILKGQKSATPKISMPSASLPNLGQAPEFVGITHWLNSEPLTMEKLRGKVVLIDFWTYTCINCIRTLPYVTSWYDKYKDKGFVVIGVHTPEFAFEKETKNVENAIKRYNIHYPVAQDNNFATWQTFNNQYWPAEYLIDAKGNLRHVHFGEGEYDKTEEAIKKLLEEKGAKTDTSLVPISDQTPGGQLTPETYLGKSRMERFVSDGSAPLPLHHFTYKGGWDIQDGFAAVAFDATQKGASLVLHFYANKVFLVVTPVSKNDRAKILLDGKPIDASVAGKDVVSGEVLFDTARLYELVNLKEKSGDHILEIDFETPGTAVYAFTFG